MARRELNNTDTKIEQKGVIVDEVLERGAIVRADESLMKAIAGELEFNEQPVTIIIHRSSEKNAPDSYYCGVNGDRPEVMRDSGKWGRWPTHYLPVDQRLTLKRKYVEVLVRAKSDNIETWHQSPAEADQNSGHIRQRLTPRTSAFATISIIEDKDPRGPAWLSEMMRRQF